MTGLILRLVLLGLIVYACAGCAPMTEQEIYERDYRNAQLLDIWDRCRAAYSNAHAMMVHVNHDPRTHGPRYRIRMIDIRSDVVNNDCVYYTGGR